MRVQLEMDVKEKEYLEEEVKKHLQGIARRMARDVMQKEFEKEIDRIVKKQLDELVSSPKYSDIPRMIVQTIATDLQRRINIDTPHVDQIVEKKVLGYMEANASGQKGIEAVFNKTLQKSIADLLKKN